MIGGLLLASSGCNLVLGLGDYSDGAPGTGGSPANVCTPGSTIECPYPGAAATKGIGACRAAVQECKADGSGYEACKGEVLPKPEDCATLEDDDCDGQPNEADAGCVCTPGATASCYTGMDGTAGKGICKAGLVTCNAEGKAFGACMGEVLPKTEDCTTSVDDDCDGVPNQPDAGCSCTPAATMPCYSGPAGTAGKGVCVEGAQTCNAQGTAYGACTGEVKPGTESCATLVDDDCDGHDCGKWATSFGDDSNQSPNGVARDSTGAIYVVGTFQGTIVFPGSTLTDNGSGDVFLVKLDAAGNHLWSKQFGDAAIQDGASIAIDSTDHLIIGGFSGAPISFGAAAIPAGAFVAKLDSAGQQVWAKSLGGSAGLCGAQGVSRTASVAVTPQNDVVVAGNYCGSINFGDSAIASQMNGVDAFVAKLRGTDGSGKVADGGWGKVFGDSQAQFARGVAVDAVGAVFVAGDFSGSINLGSTINSAGGIDVFLAKLSPAGAVLSCNPYGDAQTQRVYSLALDSLGGPIVTGYFSGTMSFPGEVVSPIGGGPSGYAFKFNAGLNYQWTKVFGDAFTGQAVSRDNAGNIFLAAAFTQSVDLGAGPLAATGNGFNIVLAKVAGNGSVLWNRQFGTFGDQYPLAIAVTAANEPILVGLLGASTDFGTGPLSPQGGWDAFVARFGQ